MYVRLERRRSAYRNVGARTFGTFYDLVVRIGTEAVATVSLDELIERMQHLLSRHEPSTTPRMGKFLLDDGTEFAFPLDEADRP